MEVLPPTNGGGKSRTLSTWTKTNENIAGVYAQSYSMITRATVNETDGACPRTGFPRYRYFIFGLFPAGLSYHWIGFCFNGKRQVRYFTLSPHGMESVHLDRTGQVRYHTGRDWANTGLHGFCLDGTRQVCHLTGTCGTDGVFPTLWKAACH